ncbi:Antitoxin, partial [Dysosmobacter welbionis]
QAARFRSSRKRAAPDCHTPGVSGAAAAHSRETVPAHRSAPPDRSAPAHASRPSGALPSSGCMPCRQSCISARPDEFRPAPVWRFG